MEAGETEMETALRELFEETGLTARLDSSRRAMIEYPLRPAGRKQVVFFASQVNGEPKIRPGEIESFKWVPAEELRNYLFPDTAYACQQLIEEKSYAFSQDLC
jgi:8-oxo-dGTP pyrophosphatase MutT (NUDIX family)